MKNYNRLIAVGDSFIWGSELQDCLEVNPWKIVSNPKKYSKDLKIIQDRKIGPYSESNINGERNSPFSGYSLNTWPALLSKHLSLEYKCIARPGGSNQTIIRQLVKFISEIVPSDLVIIDWTFMDRWDYIDVNEVITDNQWKTLRPTSDKKTRIEKFYFEAVQGDLWNKWESLRAIMLATHLLKSRGIDFIMTSEDTLPFDEEFHNPSYINHAQNEVKNYINWFKGNGFYRWSISQGFPRGKQNDHPLEEAHQAAFEYIIENQWHLKF